MKTNDWFWSYIVDTFFDTKLQTCFLKLLQLKVCQRSSSYPSSLCCCFYYLYFVPYILTKILSSTGNMEVLLSHIHSIVCAYNIGGLFLKFQSPVGWHYIIIRMETNGKNWKGNSVNCLQNIQKLEIFTAIW